MEQITQAQLVDNCINYTLETIPLCESADDVSKLVGALQTLLACREQIKASGL